MKVWEFLMFLALWVVVSLMFIVGGVGLVVWFVVYLLRVMGVL